MSQQDTISLPFLASLAAVENAGSQGILLRITTDHFISRQDQSPQQVAQFEKSALRLIAKSGAAARLAVAKKIARHPLAPASTLALIEEMGGEAALWVLEWAPLPRERLAAAAFGHRDRACALARRADLDADLVGALAMRPEPEIVLALAHNHGAALDAQTVAALGRRAEREKPLAEALFARPAGEIDPAALFLLAGSAQRAEILAAAQRMELARPTIAVSEPGRDAGIERLERYALEREPELFAGALAQLLGCGRDLADRIARDPSGEPLAVALAALGAPEDVAVRILISGDLQSGAKYTRLGSLIRLGVGLSPAAARRVIAALVGAPKTRRPQYEPVLDARASPVPSRPSAGVVRSAEGMSQSHDAAAASSTIPIVRNSG